MTKKPTSAEIEAARDFINGQIEFCEHMIATHDNPKTTPLQELSLPFYQTMQNALAWCAEQEEGEKDGIGKV